MKRGNWGGGHVDLLSTSAVSIVHEPASTTRNKEDQAQEGRCEGQQDPRRCLFGARA